jgi:hypothetical protein
MSFGDGRRRTVLLLIAALIAGCTGTAPDPAVGPASAAPGTPEPEPHRPALPDGFEPPARPEPAPDPSAPGTCDTATATAIAATVSAQLEAFARDDIAAAYALTSPFFQRLFELPAFEALIRSEYDYLLESSGHRLDECWVQGRRGYILAGVRSGTRERVLRYDVSDEPDGWRIDGAVALPGITLPPDRLV